MGKVRFFYLWAQKTCAKRGIYGDYRIQTRLLHLKLDCFRRKKGQIKDRGKNNRRICVVKVTGSRADSFQGHLDLKSHFGSIKCVTWPLWLPVGGSRHKPLRNQVVQREALYTPAD